MEEHGISIDNKKLITDIFDGTIQKAIHYHFDQYKSPNEANAYRIIRILTATASVVSILPYIYPNAVFNDKQAWHGSRYIIQTVSSILLNLVFFSYFSSQVTRLWLFTHKNFFKYNLYTFGKLERILLKWLAAVLAAYIYLGIVSVTPWLNTAAWKLTIVMINSYAQYAGIENLLTNKGVKYLESYYHWIISKLPGQHRLKINSVISQEADTIRSNIYQYLFRHDEENLSCLENFFDEDTYHISELHNLFVQSDIQPYQEDRRKKALYYYLIASFLFIILECSLLGWFCSIWESSHIGMSIPAASIAVNTGLTLLMATHNADDLFGKNQYYILENTIYILIIPTVLLLIFIGIMSAQPSLSLNGTCHFIHGTIRTLLDIDTTTGIAYFNLFSMLPLANLFYLWYRINYSSNENVSPSSVITAKAHLLKFAIRDAIDALPDWILVAKKDEALGVSRFEDDGINTDKAQHFSYTKKEITVSLLTRIIWIFMRLSLLSKLPVEVAHIPFILLGVYFPVIKKGVTSHFFKDNREASEVTSSDTVISVLVSILARTMICFLPWTISISIDKLLNILLVKTGGDEDISNIISGTIASIGSYSTVAWSNTLLNHFVY